MFEFIRGSVAGKHLDYVVLDVNGVGFRIFTSLNTIGSIETGEIVTLYTYMSVKEDDISLYGFITDSELETFKLLLQVNGVGPKMAASVLSQISVTDFSLAVARSDHKSISKVKGIGPKLAQRIVLELKDKVGMDLAGSSDGGDSASVNIVGADPVFNEAVEALMVLGYNLQAAQDAVSTTYAQGMSLEDTVKLCIRNR